MFKRTRNTKPGRGRISSVRRPEVEGLEERMLLYSTFGGEWAFGERITYSFAPDNTDVGGVSSALFSELQSQGISESVWKDELRQAAALWQSVADINVVEVSDSGHAIGISGNQQNDSRFGDVRFTSIPAAAGTLGYAYLPPPFNGGTRAGDIVLNSNVSWNVNATYDLQTVGIHEFGHSLGLDHSTQSSAVMYGTYNGIKQTLTSDDIAGIRSIYGTRPEDWLDQYQSNDTVWSAINVSSLMSNDKVTLADLDITSNADSDWFYVQAPSTASGTMTITMQSSELSSLSPRFQVYNSALQLAGWTYVPNPSQAFGGTISLTFSGVGPGTGVYIKAMGWNGSSSGVNGIGSYALQADFSGAGAPASIVSPPNTTVAEQPDQGGGTSNLGLLSEIAGELNVGTEGFFELVAADPGQFDPSELQGVDWVDVVDTSASYGELEFTQPTFSAFRTFYRGIGESVDIRMLVFAGMEQWFQRFIEVRSTDEGDHPGPRDFLSVTLPTEANLLT